MGKPSYFKYLWRCLPVLAALLGCAGTNPASAPAPIAEIPTVFSVPESVEVDVSLAGAGKALGIAAGIKAGSMDGEFSGVIAVGPDTAAENNDTLEGLLSPFTSFDIPVDPNVRTFEGINTTENQDFKFDFADFDYDGDGVPDGFTGCTCPIGCAPQVLVCPREAPLSDLKPVGFRIWIKRGPDEPFERVMVGFFDVLPVKDDTGTSKNEENPGRGNFRVGVVEMDPDTGAFDRVLLKAIYNHRDPLSPFNKTSENFGLFELSSTGTQVDASIKFHILTSQLRKFDPADKPYLEKTVKTRFDGATAPGFENPEGTQSFEAYTGRFRDDADFWSGSIIHQEMGSTTDAVPATCARISTGDGVLPDICIDLAIDTSGEDVTKGQVLSAVTLGDVQFPSDFPAAPTF